MRWLNNPPVAIQRAPATFLLVVVTSVCFLLFYPLQWVGMLELFNFVPFRAAGGYVMFGEWGDWWRWVTPTLIHFGWLYHSWMKRASWMDGLSCHTRHVAQYRS